MKHSIKFTVVGISVLLAGLFSSLAAPEIAANKTAHDWGETIDGFQMASTVDHSNGLIHCWVRNNGAANLAYIVRQFGYWECIGLEVQDGTNWVSIFWSQSWSFLIARRDTEVKTELLLPNQIITNATGMAYAHKIGRLGMSLPMPVSRGTIQINGQSFESPSPGDTFTLELLAFDWSPRWLQRRSLKCRVTQAVQTGDSFLRKRFVLRSQVFSLDCSAIASLIDRERREKKQ